MPYGQQGKGPGLAPAWKREESKFRPEPLLFPVLCMSSPTEIKRILGLSSQKPVSLPGGSGLGLFPRTGKSGHNYLGRAQLPGRSGFVPFLLPVELGCLEAVVGLGGGLLPLNSKKWRCINRHPRVPVPWGWGGGLRSRSPFPPPPPPISSYPEPPPHTCLLATPATLLAPGLGRSTGHKASGRAIVAPEA